MVDADREVSNSMRRQEHTTAGTWVPLIEELEDKYRLLIEQNETSLSYISRLEKQLVAKEQAIQILMDRVNVLKFEVANKK